MKKELKKQEIMEIIDGLVDKLEMKQEDFVKEVNEKLNSSREFTMEDYYPYMVGYITAELLYIKNGGAIISQHSR